MYIGEIKVLPPLKEWLAPKYAKIAARYPTHVALKRSGGHQWSGYAEAIIAETTESERFNWPGGYTIVLAEALPRIMERLGDNAPRVAVRAVKAPDPVVPPGGPSGRYVVAGRDWRDGGPIGFWPR